MPSFLIKTGRDIFRTVRERLIKGHPYSASAEEFRVFELTINLVQTCKDPTPWMWTPGVAVYGEIFKKYEQMGAENSWLGFPVADEVGLPDGVGRMSRFENGWIYWHPATGAHPVNIGVFRQWQEQGYEVGSWGYPTSDGVEDPGTAMISQDFQGGRYRGLE